MKQIINAALIGACLFFSPSPAAHAEGIPAALQNLTESVDLLNAIKASKQPVDEATHITALQAAVNRIIDLSDEEIKNLEDRLASLTRLPEKEEAKQNGYLDDLSGLRAHYEAVRGDVNQDKTLADILNIVHGLKQWRESEYSPALLPIVNFTAVFQNKNIIATAERRLAIIAKDEKKIKNILSPAKARTFSELLKKARATITQAAQLNNKAQKALAAYPKAENDSGPDVLLDTAAKRIRETYTYFVAMSKLIKK